ncbi:Phosphate transport (Pho88) [Novymonas esmeraldas]|uniref:Phosphate transport (Pho88) n=1 Tax=Novymonas esmeraldas TaxID=1808958 RepID=A0AAW0F9P4_9TRYP
MNILFPLTILLVSWSLDSTDPDAQKRIFFAFVAVHAAIVLVAVYLFFAIWRRADNTLVRVKDAYTGEEGIEKHWEYDLGKLRDLTVTKIGLSAAISAFAASRYGIPFPLLMQSINNPKALFQSELCRVYLRGEKPEGELQRPWKEASMIPEWAKSLWAQGEKDSEKLLAGSGLAPSSPNGGSKASRKRK